MLPQRGGEEAEIMQQSVPILVTSSAGRRRARSRQGRIHGLSLLEILIALAILSLSAVFLIDYRSKAVAPATAALRAHLIQARFEAIRRDQPVAVVFDHLQGEFLTRLDASQSGAICSDGEVLARLSLQEFRGVRVGDLPTPGLVWLPSGLGRTCQGGGVFNQTISLSDGRREGRVIVSRAGRVRSEVGR